MCSVLDRLDLEDVRLHQLCYLTLPLSVYEGTWTHSPVVAMHQLDRSCVIVGNCLKLLCSPTETRCEEATSTSLHSKKKEARKIEPPQINNECIEKALIQLIGAVMEVGYLLEYY